MMTLFKKHWLTGAVGIYATLSVIALAPTAHPILPTMDLAVVELPRKSANGRPIEELSGLAWDAKARLLYAVSDLGLIHHIALATEGGNVTATAKWSSKLAANDSNTRNAEGMALKQSPDGGQGLLVAFEDSAVIAAYTAAGKFLSELPLPHLAAAADGGSNNGIEAVTMTISGDVVYAMEKPSDPVLANKHELIVAGAKAERLRFARAGGRDTRVKAIESLGDGTFLVLEREKSETTYTNVLTKVSGCQGEAVKTCGATPLLPEGKTLPNAPIEGMTMSDDGSIVMVEDRKKKEGPSRLFILKPRTTNP